VRGLGEQTRVGVVVEDDAAKAVHQRQKSGIILQARRQRNEAGAARQRWLGSQHGGNVLCPRKKAADVEPNNGPQNKQE
jgi:hypothetical protein